MGKVISPLARLQSVAKRLTECEEILFSVEATIVLAIQVLGDRSRFRIQQQVLRVVT